MAFGAKSSLAEPAQVAFLALTHPSGFRLSLFT